MRRMCDDKLTEWVLFDLGLKKALMIYTEELRAFLCFGIPNLHQLHDTGPVSLQNRMVARL